MDLQPTLNQRPDDGMVASLRTGRTGVRVPADSRGFSSLKYPEGD